MENIGVLGEKPRSPDKTSSLVELTKIAENSASEAKRVVVYCPPIMGRCDSRDFSGMVSAKSVYAVDVQKYGFPNFDQYVSQAKDRLLDLPDVTPQDLVIVGFSEGAALAARLGHSLQLYPKKMYYY